MHINEYLNPAFTQLIDTEKVSSIFEIGSRDGIDATGLRDYFNADVFAMECNPEALTQMKINLKNEPRITLIEKAAWNENSSIPFYPVIATKMNGKELLNNLGASSCFKARSDYRQRYTQTTIEIEAIRVDDYCRAHRIEKIDMLCIDVQGAALRVLQGVGELLSDVSYIIAELEHKEIYHQQDLKDATETYLSQYGFTRAAEQYRDDWFSDYLYLKQQDAAALL